MSDRPSLQDLVEVQARFGLPSPALVEKDWFVIQALRAIVVADTGPFQLVFQGGTALSRAWRLIHRMSEDIDIKIVSEGPPPRTALRRLRESITAELMNAGFLFDPANPEHRKSNFENRYTLYRLLPPAFRADRGGAGGSAPGDPYRDLGLACSSAARRASRLVLHRRGPRRHTRDCRHPLRGDRRDGC